MSILILNRNAPYPFKTWLKDVSEELIIFTTSEREKLIESFYVEGFENYENNGRVEIQALKLFEEFKYDTVISTSEFDIIRAARIREYLGINGQTTKSANAFRDKIIMKEILNTKGILVPAFKKLNSSLDAYLFGEKYGFPLIIKPISGSGSENVYKIKDASELEIFLQDDKNIQYMEIEEYIDGEMYHVDGLYLDGKLKFCCASKYINGCLAYQSGDYNGSFLLEHKNPMFIRLLGYAKDILNSLPTPQNTAFHLEVFHTRNDDLIFCEIACRRGGGYILESIERAYGINLVEVSTLYQCGVNKKIKNINYSENLDKITGFILIPSKKGEIINLPQTCEFDWVIEQKIFASVGDFYDDSTGSLDNIAQFLIEGVSEEDVKTKIEIIMEWFETNTKWKL